MPGDDSSDYDKEMTEEENSVLLLRKILQQRKKIQSLQQRHYQLEMQHNININKVVSPYLQLNSNVLNAFVLSLEDKEVLLDSHVPEHCIPIRADVREFDWQHLGSVVKFDCIMMDPPWQLACANPTRGVAIGYTQLSDQDIMDMGIRHIQEHGFLFIWVINAKYSFAFELFKKWGYEFIDEVSWVKRTVNRRLAKSHGYYLQHAKETCLVGVKKRRNQRGEEEELEFNKDTKLGDVIFSERRGQSQKPEEIYKLIEQLVPNGKYCEVFARKNNLHNYWVSIGNEL